MKVVKNIVVYLIAALALVGIIYYFFLLPGSDPNDTSPGHFKSIYGF